MKNELFELYQQCFPTLKVKKETFLEKLDYDHSDIMIEQENSKLIGASVVSGNAILLLCVLPQMRRKGIGTKLLKRAEDKITRRGYESIVLGCGKTYLFQGMPMNEENNELFFEKNGYQADWTSIDMEVKLDKFSIDHLQLPSCDKSIEFRMMKPEEQQKVVAAVREVDPNWVRFFKTYDIPVMIAVREHEVLGFEIITYDESTIYEDLSNKTGAVGCVGVIGKERNHGIGLNLVANGMEQLKEHGCNYAFIGYTWLDKWYGKLGAETIKRFWMGYKPIEINE